MSDMDRDPGAGSSVTEYRQLFDAVYQESLVAPVGWRAWEAFDKIAHAIQTATPGSDILGDSSALFLIEFYRRQSAKGSGGYEQYQLRESDFDAFANYIEYWDCYLEQIVFGCGSRARVAEGIADLKAAFVWIDLSAFDDPRGIELRARFDMLEKKIEMLEIFFETGVILDDERLNILSTDFSAKAAKKLNAMAGSKDDADDFALPWSVEEMLSDFELPENGVNISLLIGGTNTELTVVFYDEGRISKPPVTIRLATATDCTFDQFLSDLCNRLAEQLAQLGLVYDRGSATGQNMFINGISLAVAGPVRDKKWVRIFPNIPVTFEGEVDLVQAMKDKLARNGVSLSNDLIAIVYAYMGREYREHYAMEALFDICGTGTNFGVMLSGAQIKSFLERSGEVSAQAAQFYEDDKIYLINMEGGHYQIPEDVLSQYDFGVRCGCRVGRAERHVESVCAGSGLRRLAVRIVDDLASRSIISNELAWLLRRYVIKEGGLNQLDTGQLGGVASSRHGYARSSLEESLPQRGIARGMLDRISDSELELFGYALRILFARSGQIYGVIKATQVNDFDLGQTELPCVNLHEGSVHFNGYFEQALLTLLRTGQGDAKIETLDGSSFRGSATLGQGSGTLFRVGGIGAANAADRSQE